MDTVKIIDSEGKEIVIEIDGRIQEVFENDRKELVRQKTAQRRHIDFRDIDVLEGSGEFPTGKTLEDLFFQKEALRNIFSYVDETCTDLQKRRFILHIVYGQNFARIAEQEGTTRQCVGQCVRGVLKRIREKFDNPISI